MVRTYRDFVVWQKAMGLVTQVYMATKDFHHTEVYGLTSQMRRAAVSIPSNIAEGFARRTDGDFSRFLRMACGSAYELQTHIVIALNLSYLTDDQSRGLTDGVHEIEKMLSSLIGKVGNQYQER